jgi:hypothetical protein
MKVLRVAFVVPALVACPSGPATPVDGGACTASGITVIMGTGTDSTARTFRALADGDEVYLTPGPQGAQHVWIGLRARGIDPTQPRVEMSAYRASDDLLIGRLRVRLRMIEAPEDRTLYALSSQTLIIEDDRYCSVLPGDIRITVDFDDGRGHCTRIERRLRLAGLDPLALPIDREARQRCCDLRLPRCFPTDAGALEPDASGMASRDGGPIVGD